MCIFILLLFCSVIADIVLHCLLILMIDYIRNFIYANLGGLGTVFLL